MKILLLLSILLTFSCSKSSVSQLKEGIANQCSQHPINWYVTERQAASYSQKKSYNYGPKDAEFRAKMQQVINEYINTGKDIDPQEQVGFVKKYLPNYVDSCVSFYDEAIEKCGHFDLKTQNQEYINCVTPYDDLYKELITIHFSQGYMGRGIASGDSVPDIEKIDLKSMKKEYRKLLMNGAGSLFK